MTTSTETMTANELAHLMFYGMTQGPTVLSDAYYFTRYLSKEEQAKTIADFSKTFGIPLDYIIEE